MEGVKLIVTKTLSSHFQVTHTVHMSTLGPSGYRFNATFVGDRQLGPTEVTPRVAAGWPRVCGHPKATGDTGAVGSLWASLSPGGLGVIGGLGAMGGPRWPWGHWWPWGHRWL
ncbi:mitochondrial import receptor subunit TOM40 homolog [Cyanistes caeruleus]|uniref:mitochondrial import receptor subunit TOM40 homolog n=1 Tax=Cyanistes caeruleus TaxID=156563 RepID=UPI000CDB22E1|nr:mitochondrial import receptor subunit TOM40 homolog [Cyanistes caeruleus]